MSASTIEMQWSAEAEQGLIGALLTDVDRCYESIQPLSPRHFYDKTLGSVYAQIAAMVAAGAPVDVITVSEALGTQEHLVRLNELAAGSRGAYAAARYASIVRDKSQKRALTDASYQAVEISVGSDGTVSERIDKITSLFLALQREQIANVPRQLSEIAIERTAHYEALAAGEVEPGWATHLSELDARLSGGLRPGSLYILAARPSVGKSSLAQAIGLNLARDGRKVLFLSQEMEETEMADRGIASVGRIDYGRILSGQLTDADWSRTSDAIADKSLENFYVDDQPGLTLADVRAKAKQIKGLSVLMLDYLQLCSGSGKSENRNIEIEQISRGLKIMAKEMRISIIALSQLNRKVEERSSRRPMLSDLRDSGAIEADADVVMLIWPVREAESGLKTIGMAIDKNRQGPTGPIALTFDGSMQVWSQNYDSVESAALVAIRNRGYQ